MSKKREPFTFESNLDKITLKIEETPQKVLNIVGKNLVKEIKSTTMKTQFHQRRAILTKTLGFWARKREKDLQIGFKLSIPGIIGKMITGQEEDPIKPVVVKNAQIIQDMIKTAIDEIGKKG
jgi:hypothetical protein